MEEKHPLSNSKQELPPLVVIMPSQGMGHLIPLLEFAKRLSGHHNLLITILTPSNAPPTKAETTAVSSLPSAIAHVFLPHVTLPDLPPDTKAETIICLTNVHSLPSLRQSLLSLTATHRVTALVVDLFGTDAFDVAGEFNIPSYVFFTSTANVLCFAFHLHRLDQEIHCEFKDLPEPVHIPGGFPLHGKDLMDPVQDRKNDVYKWFLHHFKRYSLAKGIIENSFLELEPEAINFLQNEEPGRPPVHPVGPLINEDNLLDKAERCLCLKWLDEQPRGSVIFVCFGSGGTISHAQTEELAFGLEMSEQRFLWVVKDPNEEVANASFFTVNTQTDPFDFLPKGFVERTKGRGFVVPSWAPQAQVLNHASTGGFVSHCGWNSILESVVNGVPLVAWPLYAEQKTNAIWITQGIKVALRPKVSENGLVERQEIASVLKNLMECEEGKKVRFRMKELKDAATATQMDGGSSMKQISQLALKWKGEITQSN